MHPAERQALQRSAFGPGSDAATREAALARLGAQPAVVESTPAGGNGPVTRNRSTVVAAAVVALAIGAWTGISVQTLAQPSLREKQSAAALVTPAANGVDIGTVTYVGTYSKSNFWSATRDNGRAFCLILERGQHEQMACTRADPTSNTQLGFAIAAGHERRTFTLYLTANGQSKFVVATDAAGA